MCLVSKSNVAYSIGICPQFLDFVSKKRNLYQDHPSMLEGSFRSFQERGVIKNVNYEKFTLTLILKKDGGTTKEVEIEGVDRLQCLFLLELFQQKHFYQKMKATQCIIIQKKKRRI